MQHQQPVRKRSTMNQHGVQLLRAVTKITKIEKLCKPHPGGK